MGAAPIPQGPAPPRTLRLRPSCPQFVKVSSDVAPSELFDLLLAEWHLPAPNLVVSLVGEERPFAVKSWLRDVLRKGLVKAAQSTGEAPRSPRAGSVQGHWPVWLPPCSSRGPPAPGLPRQTCRRAPGPWREAPCLSVGPRCPVCLQQGSNLAGLSVGWNQVTGLYVQAAEPAENPVQGRGLLTSLATEGILGAAKEKADRPQGAGAS